MACAGRNELFVNKKSCSFVRMLHPEMTRHKKKKPCTMEARLTRIFLKLESFGKHVIYDC